MHWYFAEALACFKVWCQRQRQQVFFLAQRQRQDQWPGKIEILTPF